MKQWTHDELHALMDSSPKLKEKSDKAHALPQSNEEERERGKLQMMEIYTEAIGCSNVTVAQDFTREVFSCMKRGVGLDAIRTEYSSKKLCHSPLGNDYLCFCDKNQTA